MPGVRQTQTGAVLTSGGVAQTVVASKAVIDSFEDQDLSEYTGETADYSFSTSPTPQDGSYILSGDTNGRILSQSGLDNYFAKGNRARGYLHLDLDIRAYFYFGVADGNSNYFTYIDSNNDQAVINKTTDANGVEGLAFTNVTPPTGDWIEVTVTWDDGTLGGADNDITVEYVDTTDGSTITTLSANDADHATATGIGFRRRNNATSSDDCHFDDWYLL
jgi:hypothetical protein